MSRKPITALRVSDLDTAVRFYCEGMGYQLEWHQPGEAAQIVLGGALPLLLLPLEATAFKHWLHEAYQSDAPVTRRIYVQAPMPIEAYQALLQRRGLVPGEVTAAADGTKTMALTDPDGRPVEIFQEPPLSDAEILERYEKGPAALVEALAGLTEEQLDLVRAPGKWSIRQIVHHMADSESSSLVRILMALAKPGRSFRNTPYN